MKTERELTYEERSIWGECPVCKASHGDKCYPTGIHLGCNITKGVHLGRLQKAPTKMKITYS